MSLKGAREIAVRLTEFSQRAKQRIFPPVAVIEMTILADRRAVIEECAKIAEEKCGRPLWCRLFDNRVAVAIRALAKEIA
ncbi:MAG: hypothetical protein ACREQF_07960 [Candidatus Binataceae bacterium]